VIALGLASSPALAAANRTFVSGVGTDTGTCAITAPCRTFAFALTQTASAGEIIVLSSGGYGAVTITQGVSIINTSNFAGVTVASGNGITISAGVNDSVVLRGLTIDGGGIGGNGIVFNSGGNLTIDQCNVQNFAGSTGAIGNGMLLQPTSGTSKIIITNATVTNNEFVGILYAPLSGTASTGFVIDRVSANNNIQGGIVLNGNNSSGTTTASVSNSIASGGVFGFDFLKATASLDASYSFGNQAGVAAQSSATLLLGRSVITNNVVGVQNSAATINSYQDNRIAENGTQVQGTITPVSPQ
jgi:hypothetical protein